MSFAVSVGDSVQQGLDQFFAFLPRLIAFIAILVIGYFIAKAIKAVVTKLLEKVGVDKALHQGPAGDYVNRAAPDLKVSSTIGQIAFWFLFLGVIGIAVAQLGIPLVDNFIAAIAAYLPNVIQAILIFLVAGVVSAAFGGLVARTMGDTPTGKVVGSVVPVLVMAIATFMILNALRIAPEIVTITYAALLGSAALALALAFGLGGRDVASRMLNDAYDRSQERSDDVRRDLDKGKEQAKQDAQAAKDKASGGQEPDRVGARSTGAGSSGTGNGGSAPADAGRRFGS
jgi:hypothetical protein